ncbi:MAG: hypothetical protein LCI02_27330 [Proteobacteria bacterium]|nr:hypothetical protein [Pseudomonadota bacterium]
MNTRLIRTAFWVGTPRPGEGTAWRQAILALLPAFRALPGVAAVKACWPLKLEDEPPAIACQFIVEFASRADLERMLASPERAALRARVQDAAARFDGRLSHIEYEVD